MSICVLSLSFASVSPLAIKAEEESSLGEIDGDPIVSLIDLDAKEVTASNRKAKPQEETLTPAQDLELITVIVEMEQPGVLEAGYEAGSIEAQNYVNSLLADQETLGVSAVKSIDEAMTQRKMTEKAEVIDHYTNVINGMSMRIPRSMISRIENLPGVKRVFESASYNAPEALEPDTAYEPGINHASEMIGVDASYSGGYKGEGMVIGVLDTGLDLNHSAFAKDPESPRITETDTFDFRTAVETYRSLKVPFAYDYSDLDTDVVPAFSTEDASHGTHVAGICAGNDDIITGIAPEAQIAVFKVFNDQVERTDDAVIIRALEDAVILKPDVLNLSLGSRGGDDGLSEEDASWFDETAAMGEVYQRVYDSGIMLSCAAGNNGYPGYMTTHLHYGMPSHRGIVDSPSTYDASLSVASAINTHVTDSYFMVGTEETSIFFKDPAMNSEINFASLAEEDTPEYEDCGLGREEDFEGIDIPGKIALVSYGEIPVKEKQANAAAAGAIGMVVYNNDKGSVPNLFIDPESIPAVSVSYDSGEVMKYAEPKIIADITEGSDEFGRYAAEPSLFTSWGTDDALRIKPEIMAPGENIYSSVIGGYASYSGTSMATPVTAGALTLMKGYVRDAGLAADEKEIEDIAVSLLMSTAHPKHTLDLDCYESPREQGSGLLNVSDAMAAHAYLTVDNTFGNRPKIELGDDPLKSGTWEIAFTVHNISDFEQVYDIETAATAVVYNDPHYETKPIDAQTAGETHITVPAHEQKEVRLTLTLSDEAKQQIIDANSYGGFAEGYFFLNPAEGSEDDTCLVIPFVGYYGDWNEHPILDVTPADGYNAMAGMNAAVSFDSYREMVLTETDDFWMCNVVGYNPLKQSTFTHYYESVPEGYMTVSSEVSEEFEGKNDMVKVLDRRKHSGIYSLSAALFKNIEGYDVTITDAKTGEQYYYWHREDMLRKEADQIMSDNWNAIPIRWAANDAEGNPLAEGTVANVTLSVWTHEGKATDSVTIPITIDNSRPYIVGNEPSQGTEISKASAGKLAVTASGKKYLKFEAADNAYIAGAQVGTEIETIEYSTAQDTDFTALEDVAYNVPVLFNSVYPNDRGAYTRTFAPLEAGETQKAGFDVTAYEGDTYCVSLIDYAGNKSFYELIPAETVPMKVHLDPAEMYVTLDKRLTTVRFTLVDDDGMQVETAGLKWTLSGNSGPFTSMSTGNGSVMITSLEQSELLTLTVTDPADPEWSASGLIHIVKPEEPSIELDVKEMVMLAGDVYQFTAKTVPENTAVTWETSDWDVMEISDYGEVTAMKPGTVTITATTAEGKSDSCEIKILFRDVADDTKYYFTPVYWAVDEDITHGYKDDDKITRFFKPQENCTREAVVTFLWRLAGKPEPMSTVSPFKDVTNRNAYYYKAVLWASEEGITKGYSDGTFKPNAACLREHVVTFLYRFYGNPAVKTSVNPFNDISKKDYYYKACLWAQENGIAKGYSSGEHKGGFGPKLDCLREHVVTFLYRSEN